MIDLSLISDLDWKIAIIGSLVLILIIAIIRLILSTFLIISTIAMRITISLVLLSLAYHVWSKAVPMTSSCPYPDTLNALTWETTKGEQCLYDPPCPDSLEGVPSFSYGDKVCESSSCQSVSVHKQWAFITKRALILSKSQVKGSEQKIFTGRLVEADISYCNETSKILIKDGVVDIPSESKLKLCCLGFCDTYHKGETLNDLHSFCTHFQGTYSNSKEILTVTVENGNFNICKKPPCFFCLKFLFHLSCDEYLAVMFWVAMSSVLSLIIMLATALKYKLIKNAVIFIKDRKLKKDAMEDINLDEYSSVPLQEETNQSKRKKFSHLLPGLAILSLLTIVDACAEVSIVSSSTTGGSAVQIQMHSHGEVCLQLVADRNVSVVIRSVNVEIVPNWQWNYYTYMAPFAFNQDNYLKGPEIFEKTCTKNKMELYHSREFVFSNTRRWVTSSEVYSCYEIVSHDLLVDLEITYAHKGSVVKKRIGTNASEAEDHSLLVTPVSDLTSINGNMVCTRMSDTTHYLVRKGTFNAQGVLESTRFGTIQSDGKECVWSESQFSQLDPNVCNGHWGPVTECESYIDDRPHLIPLPAKVGNVLFRDVGHVTHFIPDDSVIFGASLAIPESVFSKKQNLDCTVLRIHQQGSLKGTGGVTLTIFTKESEAQVSIELGDFIHGCHVFDNTGKLFITTEVALTQVNWYCGTKHGTITVDGRLSSDFRIRNSVSKFVEATRLGTISSWLSFFSTTTPTGSLLPFSLTTGVLIAAVVVVIFNGLKAVSYLKFLAI